MRAATVEGLTPDGLTLLLRLDESLGGHVVEVPLSQVRRAQRSAPTLPLGGAPSPREVQQRIRQGETAEDIARGCGVPVSDVARYEGPVLAERAHQAQVARRCRADDGTVEALVEAYLERVAPGEPVHWDSRQTDPYRWEVTATAGAATVLLALDPRAVRVDPVDDAARVALGLAPMPPDALDEVLRQVAHGTPRVRARPAADGPAGTEPRRGRAQVPLWDDIDRQVTGRQRDAEG